MEYVPLIVVIVLVAGVIALVRPAPAFVMRYQNGKLVLRGRASQALVAAIDEICHQNGIEAGTLVATQAGRKLRMTFSNEFSQGCQQQIRNLVTNKAWCS